ncbi:MAG: DUF542 domain-containing protein, partial [Acidobacteriota bacterium]
MSINVTNTVRELTVEIPTASRIFAEYGIDYCCGGNRSLAEACELAGVSISAVINSLNQAESVPDSSVPLTAWHKETLVALITYIIDKHHTYTRKEITRLTKLFDGVSSAHSINHPELLKMQALFRQLGEELSSHMMKEEYVLFPHILQLEEAINKHLMIPYPPFGTVKNPIRMMSMEHDNAGTILIQLRHLSNNYQLPQDS